MKAPDIEKWIAALNSRKLTAQDKSIQEN